jgi:hypothetical protein
MAEITHFAQWDQESLYEAWERYKDMLKRCPHHGLQGWVVIQTFFGGLHPQYKNDITAAAGGALMNKTYEEATELIENLAEHSYATPRSATKRVASVQEVEELKAIKAQLAALTSQLKGAPSPSSHQKEEGISDSFQFSHDSEQVHFMQNRNNRPRNDPYSNTYNEGWKKHPNLSWNQPSNQQRETMGQQQQQSGNNSNLSSFPQSNNVYRHPGFQQRRMEEGQQSDKRTGLEEMMMKFMQKMDHTVEGLTSTVNTVKSATEQNTASIRILEGQMGQIADTMNSRNKGQFPSQPEIKPRDECKAIHLRSGKQLEEQKPKKNKATTVVKDDTNEEQVDEEIEIEKRWN